jgi:hypothetical protein
MPFVGKDSLLIAVFGSFCMPNKKRKENHYERSSEFLWQINNKPRNFSSPSLYMPHHFSFYFLLSNGCMRVVHQDIYHC